MAIQINIKALDWSDERRPSVSCQYSNCYAHTPFGRFLITWKGWKDNPDFSADETPWGEWFGGYWNTLAEAQAACEQEYARRVALCLES